MAANVFVNIERQVNGFEVWLKSLTDDYLKLASFQRLAVLFRLVELCSPSELYEYSNYVTDLLRRDFLSLLPAELVDRVLSYVDHKSLLCACCVSIAIYIIIITSCGAGHNKPLPPAANDSDLLTPLSYGR